MAKFIYFSLYKLLQVLNDCHYWITNQKKHSCFQMIVKSTVSAIYLNLQQMQCFKRGRKPEHVNCQNLPT
jgi:hypothetical protein